MAVAVSNDLGNDGGSRQQMTAGNNVGDDVGNVGNRDNGGNNTSKGGGGDAGKEGGGGILVS